MAPIRGKNTTTTTTTTTTNSYEELRKQRVEENKKRIQELGIFDLAKNLSEIKKPVQKSSKPRLRTSNTRLEMVEVRRSTRERTSVVSYREEYNIELPRRAHKRSKSGSWDSYLARPVEEVRFASYEERAYAKQCAEKFQSTLQSGHPSFIKSMVRSHVYSCFWLGLPSDFCESHLPLDNVTMVLEDANGSEYDSIYKGEKKGLSGGWRGFALDHKLDDGDALVFELIEPIKFKVYIFKVCELPTNEAAAKDSEKNAAKNRQQKATKGDKKKGTKNSKKTVGKKVKSDNVRSTSTSTSTSTSEEANSGGDGSVSPVVQLKFSESEVATKSVRKRKTVTWQLN